MKYLLQNLVMKEDFFSFYGIICVIIRVTVDLGYYNFEEVF